MLLWFIKQQQIMEKIMQQPMFYIGDQLEFYKDGDRCEITRNYTLKGKYRIEYKSLKTGKKYSNTKKLLFETIVGGNCEYFSIIR